MSSESDPRHVHSIDLEVRVRYNECDPMGVAHHSAYPVWMEIARTEMLRRKGLSYRDCEERGIFFVVAKLAIRYRRPARYDDALTIRVGMRPSAGIKVEHDYVFLRGKETIASAETTIACVDHNGKLQPIPAGTLG